MEAELVSDLGGAHGIGEILLVREHKEACVAELILSEHLAQLVLRLTHTVTVIGVDNEDDTVSVLEVVAPEGAELVLTTDVPHCELDVLVLHSLDVETPM